MDLLLKLLPSTGTVIAVVLALVLSDRLLQRASKGAQRLRYQLLQLALTAIGALLIILVVPIGDTMRGQVLSLIGIVLTAAIALSSTTFLGNAMGGIMLNAVRSFRIGDFVKVETFFGRVTERGLFHTEIQTRERDLVTLPNLFLVTHPVQTIRASGTIISAELSLGYDIPHRNVEKQLIQGAEKAGLREPFVQIAELGDFSITYRVAGLLDDVKLILTVRSKLRACVLDSLHDAGIEIVSPHFMNQRVYPVEKSFIPKSQSVAERERADAAANQGATAEALVFDKAEKAETIVSLRVRSEELSKRSFELEELLKKASDDKKKESLKQELESLEQKRERIQQIIEEREERMEDEE